VGVAYGFNSPTQPAILDELPDIEPIDRSSMDAFEDEAFRQAVAATGRRRLIFGALQSEVCLAFAVVDALKAGYKAQFVTDATGSRTQTEHRTAIERLSQAGAVPNTAVGVVCELFRDWAGPLGDAAREATGWYFTEVPKVAPGVGIAEAEALRAQPQPTG
jgi:isochorismate hydrolase